MMSVIERCPTCGAAVRVVSGDEGTSHYEPITAIDALAKEVAPMTEQLRGAVNTSLRQVRKALEEIRDERPDDARHTLSFLADWLDHHAGGQ